MDNVLIDSDVILDFFFDRKPFSDHAAQIFTLCETKIIKGYITPVICSNTYYILKQVAKHKKVIEKLRQLTTVLDIVSMDRETVMQALNSGFKDFEDALQNFAAQRSGIIDVIITRNIKDYTKSEIGVMTPEACIKMVTATGS
jgi:predicted nucleic acid-binding protein